MSHDIRIVCPTSISKLVDMEKVSGIGVTCVCLTYPNPKVFFWWFEGWNSGTGVTLRREFALTRYGTTYPFDSSIFSCRMDPLLNFLQLKTCLLSVKFFTTYYLRNQNLKETNQSPVLGSCCNLVKVGSISSWSRKIVGKIMAVEPSCTPQLPQLKNIKSILCFPQN